LTYVLSTITSPVSPKVVIIYRDYNFWDLRPALHRREWDVRPGRSWDGKRKGVSWPGVEFVKFRQIHKIRKFRLELCADVWGGVGEYAVQALRQAVAVEEAQRGFDDIFPEPLVFCSPRTFRREYRLEVGKASSSSPWIPL